MYRVKVYFVVIPGDCRGQVQSRVVTTLINQFVDQQ